MHTVMFNLNQQHDPFLRLGVLGLYAACSHVRDPRRSPLYPRVPDEDHLKWEIDEDAGTITLHYTGVEVLEQFSDAIWGDFQQGFAVPPGFSDDLEDLRIYATALCHTGLTTMFIDGHHQSRKRAVQVRTDDLEQFKKGNPDIKLALEVGTASKAKKVLPGEDPEILTVKTRPYTIREQGKPRKKVDFDGKKRKKDEVRQDGEELNGFFPFPANAFHPACGIWNDYTARMGQTDLFLLSFSNLAYVFARGAYLVGVGLDLPTFKAFADAHKLYREGDTNCVYMMQCAPQVVAGILAKTLELPPNRTYPYQFLVRKGKGATIHQGNLHYTKRAGDLAAILWQGGQEPAGISKTDANKIVWRMKKAVLVAYNQEKVKTVYSQVWDNMVSGKPWYAGFSVLANRKQEDGQIGPLLACLSSQLEVEMEREIGEAIRMMQYCMVKQKVAKGWDKRDAWNKALEFMVKVNLRSVTNRTTLDAALTRIMIESGYGFTREQSDFIQSHDPQHMASLLIMALYERRKKADAVVPGAVPSDEEAAPEVAEDNEIDSMSELTANAAKDL